MDISSCKKRLSRMALVLPILLACLAFPLTAAQAASAAKDLPAGGSSFAPAPGISIDKATSIARKHTGGRVLSCIPKQRRHGMEYRVRMLVDGQRVVTVIVDHKGRVKN